MLHNKPLKTTVALTTAAPASARPIGPNPVGPYADNSFGPNPAGTAPTIVHLTSASDGFDWGDAAIGAAGGVAVSILGIGSALAVSGHRTSRQTVRQA